MPSMLLDVLFWIAVAACAVAQLFILRGVLRAAPETATTVRAPRRASEIAWAILPAFFLAAAFVLAWRAMHPAAAVFDPMRPVAGLS